jgi:hypothetical protein
MARAATWLVARTTPDLPANGQDIPYPQRPQTSVRRHRRRQASSSGDRPAAEHLLCRKDLDGREVDVHRQVRVTSHLIARVDRARAI